MYVKVSNNAVQTYPYSLNSLRGDYPETSFPVEYSDELLAEFDIYPVVGVEQPVLKDYEIVSEGTPVLIKGVWTQTWTVENTSLSAFKLLKKERVRVHQNEIFFAGYEHDFGEEVGNHTLDLRNADDKANWTLLLIKTQGMIGAGFGAAPIQLRTANNEVIEISATKANQTMTAFLTWGEDVLKRKWELDTEIDAAADLATLDAIDITSGWP